MTDEDLLQSNGWEKTDDGKWAREYLPYTRLVLPESQAIELEQLKQVAAAAAQNHTTVAAPLGVSIGAVA